MAAGHLPGAVSFPLFAARSAPGWGRPTGKKASSRQWTWACGGSVARHGRKGACFVRGPGHPYAAVGALLAGRRSGKRDGSCVRRRFCGALSRWLQGLPGGARDAFQAPRPYVVLGGMTGTAKTEVIHALTAQEERTLDLEGLARHLVLVRELGRPSPTEHGAVLQRVGLGVARLGPRWTRACVGGKREPLHRMGSNARRLPQAVAASAMLELERTEENRILLAVDVRRGGRRGVDYPRPRREFDRGGG